MALCSAQHDRRQAFAALKSELSAAPPRQLPEAIIPTSIPALDAILGGGFPRGTLVTLEGNAGRWSIAARLTAHVTRHALTAIVDGGELYPPSLAHAGVRLDRVLIAPARTPLGVARAVDILLRTRACRLVMVPSAPELRANVWLRLARLAQRAGVLLLVIAARAGGALAAATGMRVDCILDRVHVHGTRGLWCAFAGYDFSVRVLKHHALSVAGTVAARVRALDVPDGATLRHCTLAVSQAEVPPRREQRYAAVR
ncbi:MAG: hypothetical protein JOY69_02925 [Candidatus Eremiobacteraeota bacterium]|nr:hypothetical protein [Candidatus Eremiobacteraeota bacterium]MBV8372189.1 hypothetical protein [Candidatus Eremiobacteraeota bacterium]